jgi:hypothetical protein
VREEASRTSEAAMFEEMWRSRHQVAYQALAVIGQHHPDKKTAKAARATLHKASSARLPTAPHGPSSPALKADGLRQHVRSVLQVREAPGQRRDSQVLGSASENFRPASVFSSASDSTKCPARERTDGHVRAAVLDHERADQLANPPTCGKCGSPVDRARNRRGRDDYRLHWVCDSQMPNLPSPGSGEAPGQRQ